jgi:hypothetical protein
MSETASARQARRNWSRKIHPVAGGVAFLTIMAFWVSTVTVELFGPTAAIAPVKQAIAWGLLILVPSIALTGISGFLLGGKSAAPIILAKKRRMPFIGANGLIVLAPSAIALAVLSARGEFGAWFLTIQAVELIAGLVNLALIALNIRDGLALTRGRRARTA